MRTLDKIFFNRRFLLGTPGRTVALLIAFNVGVSMRQGSLADARRANLLAPAPAPATSIPLDQIRYDVSVGDSLAKYLAAIPDARSHRLAILAGMSQMYAINERVPGDETVSEHLDDTLRSSGTRVFGLAAPNLDNEEALFLLLTTLARPETTPAVFIYGLCFDKMRFVDLRPSYLSFLRDHPETRAMLTDIADHYERRFPLASSKIRGTVASLEANPAESEKSVEHLLRDEVGRAVPMVGARKDLNTYLLYNVLYAARNRVLRISNTSKRPMIPGRYALNSELLLLLSDVAKRHNVRLAVYVNPLNPQAENPYVPEEYIAFKTWAARMADSAGISFANLENAVPRDDWGLFMGGPDFMHFKGAGHIAAARAIAAAFRTDLVPGNLASPR